MSRLIRQVAALPIRRSEDGSVEVLLVTSRETRRYVIPKGWPWSGHKDYEAAAREAREEAGVVGEPRKTAIGSFAYKKRTNNGNVLVQVKVFLLVVTKLLKAWPEKAERQRIWLKATDAAASVQEPELAAIISRLPS
jgi:8-oxo-dGTP pyrophosphatase MutT (NUDIX family)